MKVAMRKINYLYMRKTFLVGLLSLIVSTSAFAGGYITNTNQHIAFLRMLARGAVIDIDGVYSNPAGLGFLQDGLYFSFNSQSAFQTRNIHSTFGLFPEGSRYYEGKASAPVIPSFQLAYKMGNWAFSGSFAIVGGGGKANFDNGLPMFDSQIIAGLAANGVSSSMYSMNSSMVGKQYIFGLQLGASYKISEYLSVFGGGRVAMVSSGYVGHMTTTANPGFEAYQPALPQIELDCDQSGMGFTPIIGADLKFGKFNLGMKYEFKTNIDIENKTKKNSGPGGAPLAGYEDGVKTPNDIPALLTAALGYEFLPTLRATVEYHHFFDKQAGMAGGKEKSLTGGTNEYLIGAEWDITKIITVSSGYQKTDFGLSDDFQSDVSFSCDSYSVGFGGAVKLSSKFTLNLAYFWTKYSDYTKDMLTGYNGLPLPGKDVYSRTNKVFGIGVNIKF